MTDDLISRAAALETISTRLNPNVFVGIRAIETVQRAIRALSAVAISQQVRVKPLVWKGDSIRVTANGMGKYYACMRMFHIQKGAGWECDEGDWHPNLDSAKAAAQAHHEIHILTALSFTKEMS